MTVEGAELDAEPEILPSPVRRGRMLGRYVLCYELASGGMATVYLARADGSSGFGKFAALKLIHPHLAKQREFVEMFLDEARLAARIVHPNVCSVFDFGAEDDTYFLAMDYLVGETVGRLMRAVWRNRPVAMRPSTPRIFARIIADACEGLHAAHEVCGDDGKLLGVVHRDVTPHNLFAGYDGSVRVVDFGVAMQVGRSHQTTAGTLKGKYPYMSPEQVKQEPVDRRSDVWSLGVCLWEMLTGRRLFGRDGEFDTLKAVTAAPIPAPSMRAPHVPSAFDPIVLRALSRDPAARYPTAREMGRELAAAIGKLGGAGAADVAELMDELFKVERAERLALLDRARRVDPEHPSTSKVAPAGVRDGLFGSSTGEQTGTPGILVPRDPTAPFPLTEASTAPIPLVQPAALALVVPRDPTAPFPLTQAGAVPIPLLHSTALQARDLTAPMPLVTPREPSGDGGRGRRLLISGAGILFVAVACIAAFAVWQGSGAGPAGVDGVAGVAGVDAAVAAPLAARAAPDAGGPATEARVETPVVADAAATVVATAEPASTEPAIEAVGAPSSSGGASDRGSRDRAARRLERAAASSGAPGTLNVVTPPGWAEIFVDGRRVGRSPTTISLASGRRSVRLVPYGSGPPIERSVTIEAGSTARLVVRLEAP